MNVCADISNRNFRYNDIYSRCALLDIISDVSDSEPLWELDELSYRLYKTEGRKIQKKNKVTSISYDEEQKLIRLKCQGNSDAYEKLVYSQLPFVVHIARKYQNRGLPFNDLISEGNIGLLDAIRKVEPGPYRLYFYTNPFIKTSIKKSIDTYGTHIRYPQSVIATVKKVQKAFIKLYLLYGWPMSIREVAEMCRVDVSVVENILINHHSELSNETIRAFLGDHHFEDFMDSISSLSYTSIDEELYSESLSKEIDEMLLTLYDIEREIIKMYFGIGCKEMSLDEIGIRFDLTRERVRQIKEKAIRRCKGLRSRFLKQYL